VELITIDSREQNGAFLQKKFVEAGIESDIICFPQSSGTDYLISNTHGSCSIQRKVALPELVSELDEILNDIVPRLVSFSDNPCMLIEENFTIDEDGYLLERNRGRQSQMLATSYYGFLETIRKSGIDVYTTRDLNHSLWWMIAMHGYLGGEHYPKHRKYFTVQEQAVGAMCCVPTIGEKRAAKALKKLSMGMMYRKKHVPGITDAMNTKLQKMLAWNAMWSEI